MVVISNKTFFMYHSTTSIHSISRLGELLKEKNLTQTQLSEMTGIPQGTIAETPHY
ncbi:helix-turn-helix domain-containing protein [Caldifermentibacillus hisashii]|uniref:helix-turn-helix domain-containing protein n=1 Tax=Caldifermentibacillus hisashii TaxID=996558 RepID=UPI003CC71E68